jgi:hypothetical protein
MWRGVPQIMLPASLRARLPRWKQGIDTFHRAPVPESLKNES